MKINYGIKKVDPLDLKEGDNVKINSKLINLLTILREYGINSESHYLLQYSFKVKKRHAEFRGKHVVKIYCEYYNKYLHVPIEILYKI